MAFDEVLLPSDIDRGAKGGPSFSTTVVIVTSGAEQRIAQWSRPRYSWDVGRSLRSYAEYDALLAFFLARQGRLRGFRYLDFADHSSAVAGVETKHLTEQIDTSHFQLRKGYLSGGQTLYRRVVKPISDTLGDAAATRSSSTVRVFGAADAEIMSGWTVDCSTGILAFTSPPGLVPKATFTYHLAVRFDADRLAGSLDEVTYASFGGIPIMELP